jgi:hypothetical protein
VGLSTASGAGLLHYLTSVFNNRELGRRTPGKRPAGPAVDSLFEGYEKRVNEIGSGRKPMDLAINDRVPPENYNIFTLNDNDPYARNGISKETGNSVIEINPNADEIYLAHELGHVASKHTDVGSMVRKLRDNPKLKDALGAALFTLPGLAAAVEAGDNDMDTSIALAAAASLPKFADEALANKNALSIMKAAGKPVTRGQYGRLAGGMLSYLTAPLLVGTTANIAGNLVDQDI